jgi:hypothetical protein
MVIYLNRYWYIVKDSQTSSLLLLDTLPPEYGSPAGPDGAPINIRDNSPIFKNSKFFYSIITPGSGYNGNAADIFFLGGEGNYPVPPPVPTFETQ